MSACLNVLCQRYVNAATRPLMSNVRAKVTADILEL